MNDTTDFTVGSIPKKMIRFMMPVLGALVLQAMYGAVDLLVVGRFGSTAGLSAVSTGSSILNLVTFVITGLAMGVTVSIGHFLGERHPEKISGLLGATIALFAVIAVVLCVIMVGFARPIAQLMQAPAEALDLTVQYIRICGAGIYFIVAYNVIAAIFRGFGDSQTPMKFVFVACLVNVFGDLFLVAGLHMNVAGAAIATVTAQAISVVIGIIMMKHKNLPFTFQKKMIRFNAETRRILQIGFPLALQELLTQISFLALCAFVNRLGLEASSGYGVACKIVSFIMLVPTSLMQSMSSFVSQNISAGRQDRARQAMHFGIGLGMSIGIVIVALIWLKGDIVSALFTTDQTVIANSWSYLKGFSPEAIVTAVMFSYNGYYNGRDKSLFVMVSGILQTFLVRLPFAYMQSIRPHADLMHIGMAAPLATMFGICLCLGYDLHLKHKE
ncbi:MATE family efflux transporter [Catenisphaera adipataccumulans]|uniref:Putative MATE family efflux protein n=1 Tax=Catenisphaera adipataccumulans TaxID=700500 RepID=A0A7W8FU06_9FIRM|nr:MATE family efflux transporter [Catenisphaera adipataccumulans]MBB5182094.1 putative MATE family efflux protein [Catenisphaera adipataccumulans]